MPTGMEKHEGPEDIPMHDPKKDPMICQCMKECGEMKDVKEMKDMKDEE